VSLRSGVGSLLGESHVVLVGARWRVFTRASLLDPFTELTGVSALRLEGSSLQSSLAIEHEGGAATISLGFGEPELVAALLEARTRLEPTAPEPTAPEPAPPEPSPYEVPAPVHSESAGAASRELVPLRAELLTLLEARRSSVTPKLALGSGDVLSALLPVDQTTASRRVLSSAKRSLDRGDREEALRTLRNTGYSAPRLVLGALLLEDGQPDEALAVLSKIDEGECPREPFVTLLEHASRAVGADAQLARALLLRRRDLGDRVARRLVEGELRAVRLRLAAARETEQARPPRPEAKGRVARSSAKPVTSRSPPSAGESKIRSPRRSEAPKQARRAKSKGGKPKASKKLAPDRRTLTVEEDAARERAQRTFLMVIACIAGALTYLFFRGR
jgi:hypothetical protein